MRVPLGPTFTDEESAAVHAVNDHPNETLHKLRIASQRLSALFQASPDAVFLHREDLSIVDVNQRALEMFGYSREQMVTFSVRDLSGKDYVDEVARVAGRQIPADRPMELEWIAKRSDGSEFPVDVRLIRLQMDIGDEVTLVAIVRDISERLQISAELAKSRREWSHAMDFFEDAIYLVDLDDRVVRANRAFYLLTGLRPEQVIDRDITTIMHPEGERTPCPVCAARKARRDTRITFEQDDPRNPVPFPVDIMVRITRDDHGEPIGVLMGIRNLSVQRRIEAELRQHQDHLEELVLERTRQLEVSNQELESFSYSVSHDLRAPLRSIDGFSQLLLEECGGQLDTTARKYLQRVRANTQRMGHLIDDLLLLSRVTRRSLSRSKVELSGIAAAVAADLQENEPERRVEFHCQRGIWVQGDEKLLRVVLENLLGNAWKYTRKEAHPVIEFGVERQDGVDCHFVRDNGVGFDMNYHHKLFGAFQRLHSMEEFPGTGIGLATVQRIIHRHGGRVWANGRPGAGATFYFTLPAPHSLAD
jgi:PAS domain S-box-containing protein